MLPQVRPRLRIETRRGLVEEHQSGLVDQAHGDIESPALSSGQGLALTGPETLEIQLVEQRLPVALGDLGVDPIHAGVIDDLLAGSRLGVGRAALGDIADASPHSDRVGPQIAPGHCGFATAWLEQGGEHPQGGGLPGAVGPEETDDLTGIDGEVDAAHCLDLLLLRLVDPAQSAGLDHVLWHGTLLALYFKW